MRRDIESQSITGAQHQSTGRRKKFKCFFSLLLIIDIILITLYSNNFNNVLFKLMIVVFIYDTLSVIFEFVRNKISQGISEILGITLFAIETVIMISVFIVVIKYDQSLKGIYIYLWIRLIYVILAISIIVIVIIFYSSLLCCRLSFGRRSINTFSTLNHYAGLNFGLKKNEIRKLDVYIYNNNSIQKDSTTIKIDNEHALCSVCLIDYTNGNKLLLLKCNHHFHKSCCANWLKLNNSCPNCRLKITVD